MSEVRGPSATPTTARAKNRGWIWFFAILASLTVAGISLEIWFNIRQQLTLEHLNQARRLWDAHWQGRPRNYRWDYTVQHRDGSLEAYRISLRDGKVVSATRHGEDTETPTDAYPYASMDALFDHLAELLEADRKPGTPRIFMTAVFDRTDGHILRFIRSVRSRDERTEINVRVDEADS